MNLITDQIENRIATLFLVITFLFAFFSISVSVAGDPHVKSCGDASRTSDKNLSLSRKAVTGSKIFAKKVLKSAGGHVGFWSVPKDQVYVAQFVGGLLSMVPPNQLETWRENYISKTSTIFFDLPNELGRFIAIKSNLKVISVFSDAFQSRYISISFSPPKEPTAMERELAEAALMQLKKDHTQFVDGKAILPILVDGFASIEFLERIGISPWFVELLDKHFPDRINLFEKGKNLEVMRNQIGDILDENGGTHYFWGDLTPKGVAQELEIYSTRDFVIRHIQFTPFSGPIELITRHQKVEVALNYLSGLTKGRFFNQDSWFRGPKRPRLLASIALVVGLSLNRMTESLVEIYDAPSNFAIEYGSEAIRQKAAKSKEAILNEKLKYLVENDPRYKNIKSRYPNIDDQPAQTKILIQNLQKVIDHGFLKPSELDLQDYKPMAEYLKRVQTQEDFDTSTTGRKLVETLSESQIDVLARLSFLDLWPFADLNRIVENPEVPGVSSSWVDFYAERGMTVGGHKTLNWNLDTSEGLRALDEAIKERIYNLTEFNLFIKYFAKAGTVKFKKHLQERLEKRLSSSFVQKILEHHEQNIISKAQRDKALLQWLDIVQISEFFDHLGVYRSDNGRRITMEDIERSIEARLLN